jgi:hypothetical protein
MKKIVFSMAPFWHMEIENIIPNGGMSGDG